jgi:hypothetical protein
MSAELLQLEKELDLTKKEIIELNTELSLRKDKKNKLIKLIEKEKQIYHGTSNLQEELKFLNVYVPDKFRIYRDDGHSSNHYVLKYNGYCFSIINRPDESYPDTFEVTQITEKKTVLTKKMPNDIPFFINLYYENPDEVTTADTLYHEKLANYEHVIENAKIIFDRNWNDELSFGIFIFYYWIRIYYQNETHENMYKMFEPQYYN